MTTSWATCAVTTICHAALPSFQLRPKEHLCVTEEITRKTYGRHGVNVVFITIAGSAGM